MSDALAELRTRLGRVADLGAASALGSWDQQTKMPVGGGEARVQMLGTLAEISHREFTDPALGRLIETAREEITGTAAGEDPDSDERRLLDVTARRYRKAVRVPDVLAADIARASSAGQNAWVAAREAGDFAAFEPYLREGVELARRYVDCVADGEPDISCAYDVLLDDYAPGMRTSEVAALFGELREGLEPIIAAIAALGPDANPALEGDFPEPGLRALVREVIGMMGFDESGWRLDDTVHPFAVQVGEGDVRLTARFTDGWSTGLYAAMHECGHGLYEAGIAHSLRRTPLGAIDSLALHESQSRLWENMVGRSRAFCEVLAPRIVTHSGGAFPGLTPHGLYRAVNRVAPSFIRVDADEATYALHVILRFELEQALIDGSLAVSDVAEAWRTRFAELLGIPVHGDADGVLQDVHWAVGLFGYFPTYALGNLISGQLWECAGAELGDLDAALAAGELSGLREWLRERVHRFGAKYPTRELLEREAGGPIRVEPFVRYLRGKLGDVYGLQLDPTPNESE